MTGIIVPNEDPNAAYDEDSAEAANASKAGMSAAAAAPAIKLSPQQEQAVDEVGAWLSDGDFDNKPFYYLGGYAGTGKTTIARRLAELQNSKTYYATYTGKAARVLRSKGCPASTIHSLIYLPAGAVSEEISKLETELNDPETPPNVARRQKILRRLADLRKPSFKKNEKIPRDMGLLVLDECSMIDKGMGEDILNMQIMDEDGYPMDRRIPILVLGDPGQLPPIKGSGFFTSGKPDLMLEEIHRQAAESPVLQLATKARMGLNISSGRYGTSRVGTRKSMGKDDATGVDQIICGSNKARKVLIDEMRQLLGFNGQLPRKGEKLICLRNNHQIGILNGQMFQADSDMDAKFGLIDLTDDDGDKHKLVVHPECFTDPELVASWAYNKRTTAQEFDYGYAITCHKSQGSEWPAVTVYADMFQWNRDMFKKWLYTGITRASDRVNVLL